jgi:chromosome partitioning protein
MFACMRVCMQTLALVCRKGGAGKTTLAIHLAAEAAADGRRVLLLDLDAIGASLDLCALARRP